MRTQKLNQARALANEALDPQEDFEEVFSVTGFQLMWVERRGLRTEGAIQRCRAPTESASEQPSGKISEPVRFGCTGSRCPADAGAGPTLPSRE